MSNRYKAFSPAVIAVCLALSACASGGPEGVQPTEQARPGVKVRMAVVESVREMPPESKKPGGGAASNTTSASQEPPGKTRVEITVRLENGQQALIVQESGEPFAPGENVRLLSGPGGTRVSR